MTEEELKQIEDYIEQIRSTGSMGSPPPKGCVPKLVREVRLLRKIIQDQQKESGLFEEGIKKGIDKFAAEYYQIVKFLPSDWHTFKRRIDETVEKLKKELNENKPTE